MRIAIAGGTGTLGRHLVTAARRQGHEVAVIARSQGVDLLTGSGVEAAVDGCEAVIDAANVSTLKAEVAEDFFRRSTSALADASTRRGVRHLVVVSIVGVDRMPYEYYAGKVAQERTAEDSGAPVTIVRATQFHEFAAQILARASVGPLHLAPRARIQPLAASAAAAHIVELAAGPARGRAADLAGPREEQLSDLVRRAARARGRRGPVIPVSLPGRQMAAMRSGDALPGPDAILLGPTYDAWSAEDIAG